MIKHILKSGKQRKDMDGYLVSREACPTAYNIMEGIRIDNGRNQNGGAQARQEVSIPGEKSQVREYEGTAYGVR